MRTLHRILVENFLSLQSVDIALNALNVLVGPNGSGKTNVLKVFQFLGDVARLDLIPAIDTLGEFDDLSFRGTTRRSPTVRIKFSGVISQHASANAPDEYTLTFWQRRISSGEGSGDFRRLVQRSEEIILKRTAGRGRRITLTGGSVKVAPIGDQRRRTIPGPLSVQSTATGLATLRRLGEDYEAVGVEALAQTFEQLRLFEIDVERVRRPARTISSSRLRQDAANLAPYLLHMKEDYPEIFETILDDVRFVLPSFRGFVFTKIGGADEAVRIDIEENALRGVTPLARASFGTIRAIALFAMLADPDPPSLTCLEEIDHGLHPHALDRLIERVRDASTRTQIILATHSPALVNRLEATELIVVERNAETGATAAFRPDRKMIARLQHETGYALGELWFSGALGGGL